jgi:hypothetical protein
LKEKRTLKRVFRKDSSPALLTCTKGAVLAEFIVALPVLLLSYFCFLQMGQAYTASLVMRHASMIVARYASVSYPTSFISTADQSDDTGLRNASWKDVAQTGLGPWRDVVVVRGVQVHLAGGTRDPSGEIETKVDFVYSCHVPIAKFIVCQNTTFSRSIRVLSPLHGARYVRHAG